MSSDLVFRVWKRWACQAIWCSESGIPLRVKRFDVHQSLTTLVMHVKQFGLQNLESLCMSSGLVYRVWKPCPCQAIWCSESGTVARVNRFGLQNLETLCMSSDVVFSIWKRCACQRIWCSEIGNVLPIKRFGVQSLEILCMSRYLMFRVWKPFACQAIWRSEFGNIALVKRFFSECGNVLLVNQFGVHSPETLCPSNNSVFRVWKSYSYITLWCSKSGDVVRVKQFDVQSLENVVPVEQFGIQSLETLCVSSNLAFRVWNRCVCQTN